MFRIVNTKTNGLLFSSNSIYGIIDLFLINWGRLPDFTINIDMTNEIITFNNENYTIEYINIATPPRGEEPWITYFMLLTKQLAKYKLVA